jgi:hypothetical protein
MIRTALVHQRLRAPDSPAAPLVHPAFPGRVTRGGSVAKLSSRCFSSRCFIS